jgi:hypothetical protein
MRSILKKYSCWEPVAHICNPSYSGGREQEYQGLKPAWANSLRDPILKKPITKKGWWNGSRIGPEFKPQYCQKKKKPQITTKP